MPQGRRLSPPPYLPYEPGMLGYEDIEILKQAEEPIDLLKELVERVGRGEKEPLTAEWLDRVRRTVRRDQLRFQLQLTGREEQPRNNAWWGDFLEELQRRGNIAASCRKAGISQQRVSAVAKRYPGFRAAMEEAKKIAVGRLHERGMQLAESGDPKMITFFLKVLDPETYGGPDLRPRPETPQQAANNAPRVEAAEDYRKSTEPLAPLVVEGNYEDHGSRPRMGDALADLARGGRGGE